MVFKKREWMLVGTALAVGVVGTLMVGEMFRSDAPSDRFHHDAPNDVPSIKVDEPAPVGSHGPAAAVRDSLSNGNAERDFETTGLTTTTLPETTADGAPADGALFTIGTIRVLSITLSPPAWVDNEYRGKWDVNVKVEGFDPLRLDEVTSLTQEIKRLTGAETIEIVDRDGKHIWGSFPLRDYLAPPTSPPLPTDLDAFPTKEEIHRRFGVYWPSDGLPGYPPGRFVVGFMDRRGQRYPAMSRTTVAAEDLPENALIMSAPAASPFYVVDEFQKSGNALAREDRYLILGRLYQLETSHGEKVNYWMTFENFNRINSQIVLRWLESLRHAVLNPFHIYSELPPGTIEVVIVEPR